MEMIIAIRNPRFMQ